ncbi:MAG: hypothetical protein ACMUIE_08720 [Thermoplasmatota archaeon]
METANLILLLSGLGLVLVLAWTMYRIDQHRKKTRKLDEMAIGIGKMSSVRTDPEGTAEAGSSISPMLPTRDILVVMYKDKNKPWRSAVRQELRKDSRVMVVSTRSPTEIREIYPGIERMIWLDRSRAHKTQRGVIVVNPTNLSGLLEDIRSSLGGTDGRSFAVFEGFEEVINANDPARVMRFLTMLKQTCGKDGISAVVTLPYRAVAQRTKNQLLETFETVVV